MHKLISMDWGKEKFTHLPILWSKSFCILNTSSEKRWKKRHKYSLIKFRDGLKCKLTNKQTKKKPGRILVMEISRVSSS